MTVNLEPTQLTPVKKLDPANVEIADLQARSRFSHQQSPLHGKVLLSNRCLLFGLAAAVVAAALGFRSWSFVQPFLPTFSAAVVR
jgi:hypothetical protein